MRNWVRAIAWWTLAGATFLAADAACADDPPSPRPSFADEIAIHGFVSFAADANFNRPDPDADAGETFARNRYRAFDTMANTLSLDVATLTVERVPQTPHDIGVRIDLAAGQTVPQGEAANGSGTGPFDLQRAYMYFVLASGLRVDLGKFTSPAGPERIEGYEDENDEYSHSFAFTFGPKTHTGVKAAYTTAVVTVATLVTTGWDVLIDNNTDLSFGALVLLTPCAGLSFQLLYLGGKELPDPDPPFRHFLDAYATLRILPSLKAIVHATFGHEGDGDWWGLVGYLSLAPPGDYSVALRGEVFSDPDGTRTQMPGGQTLGELTVTGSYKLGTHHAARLELRWDRSSHDVFATHDGVSPNQVTLAANYLGKF
jgi:Putative beta-barrel porin-2, OmpL-like. bbp2